MEKESTVKAMNNAVQIEYSDNSRQIIPKGCLVYVWVRGSEYALEGRFSGFEDTEALFNVMGYGTLRIPFDDITGIHKKGE